MKQFKGDVVSHTLIQSGSKWHLSIESELSNDTWYFKCENKEVVKGRIFDAARVIVREYMITYLKNRIRKYKAHKKNSPDTEKLKNLLHHVTHSSDTKGIYLGMFAKRTWRHLLLRTRPIRDKEKRAEVRAILDMCERRGVHRIYK